MNRILHFSILAALAAFAAPACAAGKVDFTPSRPPVSEEEMAAPFSSAVLRDGKKEIPLQYHVLFHPGDEVGGVTAGLIVDKEGRAVAISAPDNKGNAALGPFNAWGPDANS